MGSKKSSRKRKQNVLQKKEDLLKEKKRPTTASGQLQADSALLQQTLGNEAIGHVVQSGSSEATVQKKVGEQEQEGAQAGIQQILNRQVSGQTPSIQRDDREKHLRSLGRNSGREERRKQRHPEQYSAQSPKTPSYHQGLTYAATVNDPAGGRADQTSAAFENRAAALGDKDPEKAALNDSKAKLDVMAGSVDTIVGLQSLSQSWQDYKSGKLDAEGRLAGVEGVAKAVGGSTKAVDAYSKSKGNENGVGASDMAGKATGLIADSITTVKEGFSLFKNGWSQFREAKKKKKLGAQEAGQLMLTASKGIQAGFKVAKGWYDVLGSKVPADVLAGIPVMGIIINGLDIMLRAFDFYRAYKSEMALKEIDNRGGGAWTETSGEQELRRELTKIGVKREKRAGADITLGLMSIVGDIMNLTGAGIAAGIGVKMTAGAAGAAQTGARGLKQWARDKAAGGSGWAQKIANKDKSTEAKHSTRNRHAGVILDMLRDVRNLTTPYAQKVNTYVEAAGSNFDELASIGADKSLPRRQRVEEAQGALAGAMAKR